MRSAAPRSAPALPAPDRATPWLAILAALVLGMAIRLPSVGLPIAGPLATEGARAATLVGHETDASGGGASERGPPLFAALLAVPISAGATVTASVRWTALLLGALAGALTVAAGARWGPSRPAAPWIVPLVALHPVLVAFGGGLTGGAEALAASLVLASVVASTGRFGLARALHPLCAALAPLARLDALPFALAAAACPAPRADGVPAPSGERRWLRAALVLAPATLWCGWTWLGTGGPPPGGWAPGRLGTSLAVLLVLGIPAAALVVLLPVLPRGLRALWDGGGTSARAALLAALGQLALAAALSDADPGWKGALAGDGLRAGSLAVPFVVVAVGAGMASSSPSARRRFAVAALLLAAPTTLYLQSGALQRALPWRLREAGRLSVLADAYRRAVALRTGEETVVLDLDPHANPGVDAFLGDASPTTRTARVAPADEATGRGAEASRFDAARDVARGGSFLLLSDRGGDEPSLAGPIYTAGGQGIFHRARLERVGPARGPAVSIHHVRRP